MAVTRSKGVSCRISTGIPSTINKRIMKKNTGEIQGQECRKKNKNQEFVQAKQDCYDGAYANGLKKLRELVLWDVPPKNPTFRAYLAFFQLEIGKYREAILAAEESLKIKSTALAHKTRFHALLKLGRISEGKKILDGIKRLRSSHMRRLCEISVLDDLLDRHLLLLDQVKVHFEGGLYELTIQKCETGLRSAPLDSKLLMFKMGSLFFQKRYSDVVKLRSIDVVMENLKCREWISLSYYLMLDMVEAVNVLMEVQHASSAPLCATLKKIHELWEDADTSQDPVVVCEAARSALDLMAQISSNTIPVVNRELEVQLMKLAFSCNEKLGNKHEVLHLLKKASDKGYEICSSPLLKTILEVSEQLKNKCWKEAASIIESRLLSNSPPAPAEEFPTLLTSESDVSMWTEKLRVVKILAECKSRRQLDVVQAAEIIEYKNDLLKSNLADLKKSYNHCIRKYHPDKQSENLDKELKILYEELTKISVQAFEVLKKEFSNFVENQKKELKRKEDEKNKQVFRSDLGRDPNYYQSAEWASRKAWFDFYEARQKMRAEEKVRAAAEKKKRKEEERRERRKVQKEYEHYLANRK